MFQDRVGNREKAIFLAGGLAALLILSFASVMASGAASDPVIEAYGGDVDVHGNDIRNLGELPGFFDTACSGDDVVSRVFDNGTYQCSSVSNTLSEVLASGNSAGSNNLDMNGNNISNVDWLNPDGQELNLDTNLSLSPDGDSASSGDVRNAGVVYAQAITGADAPSYNFQVASENDLRFVADRDASTGGAHTWIIDKNDGSLNADGDIDLAGNHLKDTGIVFANTFQTEGSNDLFLNADNDILFRADKDGDNGGPYDWRLSETDGSLSADGDLDMNNAQIIKADSITNKAGGGTIGNRLLFDSAGNVLLEARDDSVADAQIEANGDIDLRVDVDGDNYLCWVAESDGSWNCDGTKNWVHPLNETHEMAYTSQESPQVRAVVEDTVTVEDGAAVVALPEHFSETIGASDGMTVQVTPHELATVAAVQRNMTHITIEADSDAAVAVDYRVTGIRDGYEDKQVVRRQAKN